MSLNSFASACLFESFLLQGFSLHGPLQLNIFSHLKPSQGYTAGLHQNAQRA